MDGPWIKVIDADEAAGRLREVYDETLKKRGALAEIHKIHSLNPESLVGHMELYMTLMFGRSPVPRRERELVGVAVSRTNGCPYCVSHHCDALARYEKRGDVLSAVREGRWGDLDGRDALLCRHVEKLTASPGKMTEADVSSLREAGLSDQEILDVTQIAAYFNFVNRLVLGLGVRLESAEKRADYKY